MGNIKDMKSFGNSKIRSKNIRVEIFYSSTSDGVRDEVNNWLSENDYEIISIDFDCDSNYKRVLITYRVD